MAKWKEPITFMSAVSPYPKDVDLTRPDRKTYTEHETDVVIVGVQDGLWFIPLHRRYRHFVDDNIIEYRDAPLASGEEKWRCEQSSPVLENQA